jgi:hypothetical protein
MEEDDEELQECFITTLAGSQDEVKRVIAIFHLLGIHNWRQLANANSEHISEAMNIPPNQVEKWNWGYTYLTFVLGANERRTCWRNTSGFSGMRHL